jgi:hypothetical protein
MSAQKNTTQTMTARTQSFAYQPSPTALATRSWTAVKRVTDPDAHREAVDRHFDRFGPAFGLSGR